MVRQKMTENEKQKYWKEKGRRLRAEAIAEAKRVETTEQVNKALDIDYAHSQMSWSKGSVSIRATHQGGCNYIVPPASQRNKWGGC